MSGPHEACFDPDAPLGGTVHPFKDRLAHSQQQQR